MTDEMFSRRPPGGGNRENPPVLSRPYRWHRRLLPARALQVGLLPNLYVRCGEGDFPFGRSHKTRKSRLEEETDSLGGLSSLVRRSKPFFKLVGWQNGHRRSMKGRWLKHYVCGGTSGIQTPTGLLSTGKTSKDAELEVGSMIARGRLLGCRVVLVALGITTLLTCPHFRSCSEPCDEPSRKSSLSSLLLLLPLVVGGSMSALNLRSGPNGSSETRSAFWRSFANPRADFSDSDERFESAVPFRQHITNERPPTAVAVGSDPARIQIMACSARPCLSMTPPPRLSSQR